jgi:3-oxoacyl-[acyl-carrier protein] reductase
MKIDLSGRVAVVTGASRGIGRAIALELASSGAKVVVNYNRSSQAAQKVVEAIEATGGEALAVQADVAVAEKAQNLIDAAVSSFGQVDILVNNAGTTRDNLLVRMSEEEWDIVLDLNLKGAFNCTKSVTKTMMKQRYGRIINVTSVSGLSGNAGQANYSAAKAGLIGFTKSVAKELGSRDITVNAVAPGFVETDLTVVLGDERINMLLSMTPVGRLGSAEDIAYAVVFLASDRAGFVTGQVLSVDGGLIMQ